MATYEKTKQELLIEMREKREQRRQAKLKLRRRRCIAAAAAFSVLTSIVTGTVYNAYAKEITITEINEFEGKNESRKVRTRGASVEEVLEEHGLDVGTEDRLNVSALKPVSNNEDIVIKRGKRIKIKTGDREEVVTVTKADITDALVEAGYIPGEYDVVSSNGDTLISGDTIELVSISHTEETITEAIPRGIEYVDDADMPVGSEYIVDEGWDGIKKLEHKVTYQDGQEAAREIIGETVELEAKNKIIARGTAVPTPVPKKEKAVLNVSDNAGTVNGYRYKKKIVMTATAYSTAPSENGGYTVSAMGNPLGYGIVAVDPNVIPLGSKVYVTSPDGSWSYGVASAEDTGGAIRGNKIDLCYDTNASAFGRKSCVVYVLE